MSSEISNVVKLTPVTVVKPFGKQDTILSVKSPETKVGDVSPADVQNVSELQDAGKGSKTQKNKQATAQLDVVKKAVEEGNSLFQATKRNLQFKVDEATQEVVVKIVDSQSGEVVKQIPSEEMLALVKRMQELDKQQGTMLQDHA